MIACRGNPGPLIIFHNNGWCKLLNSSGRDEEMKRFPVCPILFSKSLKIDCNFEQQQTRTQQNRLLTQRCLLGPGNVSCSKAGKICIRGCTPSSRGQSPVWLLSNSNRISHFSNFTLLSLVLSSRAFSAWYCVRLLGRDGSLLWAVLLSSNCCLLLSHLLSNGLLLRHLQATLV